MTSTSGSSVSSLKYSSGLPSDKQRLKLASFNVKNVNANIPAIQQIIRESDIIGIQETWLFNYEHNRLNEINTNYFAAAKSVDDDNPITPYQRPRGYGGVAIFWKKSLNHMVKSLHDGGKRIICCELVSPNIKTCIINTYMPCRGRSSDEAAFDETLDELGEIIAKYSCSHTIIIMGDLNASLNRPEPSYRDKKLITFCGKFKINAAVPSAPTFFHVNGRDRLQSDYILINKPHDERWSGYRTHDLDAIPSNVSDHIPVSVSYNLSSFNQALPEAITDKHTVSQYCPKKINWHNVDLTKYSHLTSLSMSGSTVENCVINSQSDLLSYIVLIGNSLSTAADKSLLKPNRRPKKSSCGIKIWDPAIATLVKENKQAHYDWKNAGSPTCANNPLSMNRKVTKRNLRAYVRQKISAIRINNYNRIMQAQKDDTKLFHKLVQDQRSTKQHHTTLLKTMDGDLVTPDEICNGFATHFNNLASCKNNPAYSCERFDRAIFTNNIVKNLCHTEPIPIQPLTAEELHSIIKSFTNGKAEDHFHLAAEHFKYAHQNVLTILLIVINYILSSCEIPSAILQGTITPILKKGKDGTNCNNYRGITVTAFIGKIIEKAWLLRADPILRPSQNVMQRGFTRNCAPTNAALLISESISEAKVKKKPLYVTFLDASKAFDVVNHDIMLDELYKAGIKGDLWLLIKNLYHKPTSRLKWQGLLSAFFVIDEGVRQGGVSSAPIYKTYTNPLLNSLQSHHTSHRIGDIVISAPTCADDVAIVTTAVPSTQMAVRIVEDYSSDHCYTINPTKSATIAYFTSKIDPVTLDGVDIPVTNEATHLGISRNQSNSVDVDNRIQLGRRTAYAMMGAGLHGRDGLTPSASFHLWMTYVIPRLLFGLEVVTMKKSDVQRLELFQRKFLRRIQFLPESPFPATCAIYAIIGAKPVEFILDQAILTLFGSILRDEDSIEYRLAVRQLAMKSLTATSWFSNVRRILMKYDLPSAYDLLENPLSKSSWKTLTNDKIKTHIKSTWLEDAKSKSSLKYLNIESCEVGKAHILWATVPPNVRDVEPAAIKARLLTGTYVLQANRARFNQYNVDPTCLICSVEPEDRMHFLIRCPVFNEKRAVHLQRLRSALASSISSHFADVIFSCESTLLQLLLDCSHQLITHMLDMCLIDTLIRIVEPISRRLIFNLHSMRSVLIKELHT